MLQKITNLFDHNFQNNNPPKCIVAIAINNKASAYEELKKHGKPTIEKQKSHKKSTKRY